MKTLLLASAAMLCFTGAAYADSGDDEGSMLANTFFTELPGVVSTAPGAIPNDVAVNAYQQNYQATTHAANTWMAPDGTSRPLGTATSSN